MDKKMTPELAKRFIEQMNPKLEELNLEVILVKKGKESQQKNELADRDEKIKEHEKSLNEKEFSLKKREAEIEGREIAVSAQEKAFESVKNNLLKMSEEVAAKKAELFSNAEKLAAELHEKRIAETNEQIQKMRDSANESCEKLRAEAESSAEKTRNDAESNAQKIRAEANSAAEKIRIEAQNECKRIINDANAEAQKIISKAKSDTDELEKQIADLTKKNAELSGENTKLASQILALTEDKCFLDSEIKSQKQNFDDTTRVYAKTMSAFETLKVQLESNGKSVEDFTKQISEMDTREQALNAREDELNERDRKLSFNERRNNNKKDELDQRESNLESEVEKKYPEIIADKDQEIDGLKKETESLRNSLHANKSIVAKFDDLTAQFGGKNAAEILSDYQRVQQELSIALEKLNNTPSYALQKTASDLQEKENLLKERENALAQKERDSQNLRDSFAQSQAEKEELKLKNENLEKDKKIVEEQLARLRSTYENPAERDERIKEINKPLIMEHFPRLEKPKLSEMEWLNNIEEKIEKSGLHFPRRILNAFHTALKTSEMSPLTVLAGVSGTGKSELPRLYSRFGGINFLGMPVQPNWDCQESMLGYYNSIDNCFEPTDMLRLLAQSQPLEKKYQEKFQKENDMSDVMTMILLDEMNLANVELYFADFLSKLETRRGLADNDPTFPKIGVKIGSKMADFDLKLGRNVLWTGTMNNDETTKTLSDKVIDRGILINFPRPKKLIGLRREIELAEPAPLLPYSVWSSWIDGEKGAVKFSAEQIKGYKEKVEQINEQLGKTGRALGHRVWQSIESYMSLYPSVIAAQPGHERKKAMDEAFEDQIVQKIMPKLRGLETRGTQNDVLEAIKAIIPDTLHEDFKNACEQNYGQFIWTTSGYLLRGDDSGAKKGDETESSESEKTVERKEKTKD
ncbi:MAG: hypothetical protein UHO11_09730 [Treponema sp.]|nr:hypothetical protein [Treponema sp.]